MRSHLSLPSINSLVSSKGRLFTVEDQGSAEPPALPGRFALVARDAFNGIVLWQRSFPDWQPVNIYTKFTPVQVQRRLRTCLSLLGIVIKFGEVYFGRRPKAIQEISE